MIWPEIPGETGLLAIACRDGGKTALSRREIAIDPATMDVLAQWRAVRLAMAGEHGRGLCEDGYVFTSELAGELPWMPDTVTRRVARVAAQTGVSVNVSGLRHYSMTRLIALGVPADVLYYRMGVSFPVGMVPMSWLGAELADADREAALLLGRELDQAVTLIGGTGAIDDADRSARRDA